MNKGKSLQRGSGYELSPKTRRAIRHRKSDAQWRANLSSSFTVLARVLLSDSTDEDPPKISKALVLEKTVDHLTMLESTVEALLKVKAEQEGNVSDFMPKMYMLDHYKTSFMDVIKEEEKCSQGTKGSQSRLKYCTIKKRSLDKKEEPSNLVLQNSNTNKENCDSNIIATSSAAKPEKMQPVSSSKNEPDVPACKPTKVTLDRRFTPTKSLDEQTPICTARLPLPIIEARTPKKKMLQESEKADVRLFPERSLELTPMSSLSAVNKLQWHRKVYGKRQFRSQQSCNYSSLDCPRVKLGRNVRRKLLHSQVSDRPSAAKCLKFEDEPVEDEPNFLEGLNPEESSKGLGQVEVISKENGNIFHEIKNASVCPQSSLPSINPVTDVKGPLDANKEGSSLLCTENHEPNNTPKVKPGNSDCTPSVLSTLKLPLLLRVKYQNKNGLLNTHFESTEGGLSHDGNSGFGSDKNLFPESHDIGTNNVHSTNNSVFFTKLVSTIDHLSSPVKYETGNSCPFTTPFSDFARQHKSESVWIYPCEDKLPFSTLNMLHCQKNGEFVPSPVPAVLGCSSPLWTPSILKDLPPEQETLTSDASVHSYQQRAVAFDHDLYQTHDTRIYTGVDVELDEPLHHCDVSKNGESMHFGDESSEYSVYEEQGFPILDPSNLVMAENCDIEDVPSTSNTHLTSVSLLEPVDLRNLSNSQEGSGNYLAFTELLQEGSTMQASPDDCKGNEECKFTCEE